MELLLLVLVVVLIVVALRLWVRGGSSAVDALLLRTADAFRMGEGLVAEEGLEQLRASVRGARMCRRAATLLMDAGAWEPALEFAQRGLEEKPGDKGLVRLQALIGARMLTPDGVDHLARYAQLHPGDTEARAVLARALLRLRRLDELILLLTPDVTLGRATIETHSLLGRAFFHKGALERAREHLQAAMKLRQHRRRQSVSLYDTSVPAWDDTFGGVDVKDAVPDRWEAEHDHSLLEQIASGEALRNGTGRPPELVAEPDEAAIELQASRGDRRSLK